MTMAVLKMVLLVFFFIVFVGVGIWAFSLRKETLERLESMPLDDDNGSTKVEVNR